MKKKITAMLLSTTILLSTVLSPTVSAASVKDLLSHALEPIGNCLYVYGGGWNEPDTGAGVEAMTYGISPKWQEFYKANNSSYNYNNHRYEIHNGLDCTGYVGWSVYQIFGNQYSDNGYVFLAENMAQKYAEIFDGTFTRKKLFNNHQSGDIMSSSGHAYIVLGGCEDGSVVFLHASPPAVSICGTYTPSGKSNSRAVELATHYMKTYFPDCYNRYPRCSRNTAYLTDYNQMRWNENILTDSDGYRYMPAEDILWDLFENIKIYHNDQRIKFSVNPFMWEYTTYIPLRETVEKFGGQVTWNMSDRTTQVNYGEKTMKLDPQSKTVEVNDNVINCELPITEDRTMIPVRVLSNFLGFSVEWEGSTKSVYLK